ncbi:hypothetical protein [Mycobacterium sp. PSTR-4-N]|uniref:hypothetical protein n=1 Tax=Mycobacterium sp. PSTR-4-N TaxID=2917745 RepID=UPI001F14AF01|nr:hypothetical protein [Mycobacterium sp. PSTR-4-N]MCG7595760.1 hypothetical protein [Mycobacterium sp. PSTR-4-N]
MSATTTKTRRSGQVDATPEVDNATEEKAAPKLFTATGRSGQPTTRKAPAGTKFAVDVQRDGKKAYQEGVVVKFFTTEEAAQKFADRVNAKDATLGDWYETAHDAVVVAAEEVQ